MTGQNNQENTSTVKDSFQVEFEALPLEQKFARLFEMEAVTISEAIDFAINSPMKVVEKVGDVISELGVRIEREVKKATQYAEKEAANEPRKPAGKNRAEKKSPPPSAGPMP